MEPNKSMVEGELHQEGCTRVQYFSSLAIPVPPGASLEPRHGRPSRSGAERRRAAVSPVDGTAAGKTEAIMGANRWQIGQEFVLLDLVAQLEFQSASSLSFHLGTKGDTLHLPDREEPWVMGPGMVFTVIGWVDVHHPCEGHIKTQLRICLPEKYHEPERMRGLVHQLFEQLGIPADETYEALFVAASRQTGIEQARDRNGMTDRLY